MMDATQLSLDQGAMFADFSPCRRWRYLLGRRWGTGGRYAMFVGLNPSTADETEDDPTVRRCIRFARDWGYDALAMLNLFAWRSTDPHGLIFAEEPVGLENDRYLRTMATGAGVVIAAWGVHGVIRDRARRVVDAGMLGDFRVLGLTNGGHPRHPLYMPAASRPLNPLTLEAGR